MKQPIRFFALGLLTAGIICLVAFYLFDANQEKPELSTKEMVKKVESEGYHVLTESEYISVSVQSDEADTDSNDNNNEQNSRSDDTTENNSETYTLTVESGMTPSNISETLAQNNIIDDADEFTQYMENEGYSKLVQLGEFKLTSAMSRHDIAEVITN
ncbi:endolytic transglycosylase MltG [Lentibacillus cibarius]|uniref:Endolytic transglycosylase MltG n=1 Tax=Lentibacillus cibarius TaxID=2583219 RepID=A0A549YLG5_9BACI|nr:endolytic transglycosylase MltG [Lentibacillus cibarius]TRM12714.1 endolytic transglycosylase MltG [Lentibacillus cibarius]